MKFAKPGNVTFNASFVIAAYLCFSALAGWGLWNVLEGVREQLRTDLFGLTVDVVRTTELTSRYVSDIQGYFDDPDPEQLPLIIQHIEVLKGREAVLKVPAIRINLGPAFQDTFLQTLDDYVAVLEELKSLITSGPLQGERLKRAEDLLFAVEDGASLLYTESQDYIQGNVEQQHHIQKMLSIFLVGLIVSLLIVLGGLVFIFGKLRKAQLTAERANRDKSHFLAAASHDLRQPLQALNLFLFTLSQREHDEKSSELIARIGNTSSALEELLNALLDISRLDAGVVEPEKHVISIAGLLSRIGEEFEHVAKDRGLKLNLQVQGANVQTDPVLLENILRNLISNAIRYTDAGEVFLSCSDLGDAVRVTVADTGKGIEPEHLGDIFQEFYQIGNPERDRRKGLGLGLSIVKKTSELLGLSLDVKSTPSKGTSFYLDIPKGADEQVPVLADPQHLNVAPIPEGVYAVVIEDDVDVRSGLKILLEDWGCKVLDVPCVGRSGDQGCADCTGCDDLLAPNARKPDLILADYNLRDGLTGTKAVEILRSMFQSKVPAVMLTGNIAGHSIQEIKDQGAPLLFKPIHGGELYRVVSRTLMAEQGA